jgi:hypothetical protein
MKTKEMLTMLGIVVAGVLVANFVHTKWIAPNV